MANKILAVASFFAAGAPSGLSNIYNFKYKHMCFTDSVRSSQALSQLYRCISHVECNDFFQGWIKY